MKKFFIQLSDHHSIIYKGFLFVTALVLIVMIFPKEGKFKYEFQKGKPWSHEDIRAPFNFSIYKSVEEVANEKEQIRKSSKPYFIRKSDIYAAAEKKFNELFEENWNPDTLGGNFIGGLFKKNSTKKSELEKIKIQHLNRGRDLLRQIFNKGVIEPHSLIENKPLSAPIMVLQKNIAEEYSKADFFSINSASGYIQGSLEGSKKLNKKFISNLLLEVIDYNIIYDSETTEKIINNSLANVSETRGMIEEGTLIILKGEIVDAEKYQILESLKIEKEQLLGSDKNFVFILSGQIILVASILLILFMYIGMYHKEVFALNRNMNFLILQVLLFVFISGIAQRSEDFNSYLIPYCLVPMIIRTFFDARLALFVHLVIILIAGFLAPNGFEFVFLQIIAGNAAVFSLFNLRRRSQLFKSSLYVFMAYSVSYLGMTLIQEGNIEMINWRYFGWFGASAGLTFLTTGFIYLFERMFGFVSDVKLMELLDTNSPLLRELAEKAPGTFQHSIQVANLAEEAIHAVGGSTLMVRTGALYHDIGKMNNPTYFIENQSGYNPHDELPYEDSAKVIIQHVIDGIEMAKKNKLPDQIIDFIRTHHGTTMTQYFYRMYLKDNPDEKVDLSKFKYPGPLPYSKETAVLMMADSVEAASRSMKEHTSDSISNLVENIINGQVAQDQFINANVTFKDLTSVKKIFKKKLGSIYHVRVEYPK